MSSEADKMETESSEGGEKTKTIITVNVKTPKEKKAIKVEDNASIKEFKAKISAEFNGTPAEQLCLIFAGKMLKDHENLELHSIKDNVTVHLVIKTGGTSSGASAIPTPAERQAAASRQANANIAQTPFGLGGVGGLPGIANLGMGSANFMELQHQMQETMRNNPAMLRQLIDSPLTQNLMTNPEIMKGLMLSNPQLTRLMDRNPEMYDLLGNQDVLRQTMDIARNPDLLQELMGIQSQGNSESQNTVNTQPTGARGSNALTGSALYGSAGMHSLMQQMADNPSIMQNMMNAPYTQSMLQSMVESPDMAANLVGNSPLFVDNPQMQEQMRNIMPAFMEQMKNPAVQSLMSNPDALRSLVQIQGGLQALHSVSPDLYASLSMPNVNAGEKEATSTKTNESTSESGKDGNSAETAETGDSSTAASSDQKGKDTEGMDPFKTLMNSMVNRMVDQGLNAPPEERFKEQLETLASMGFVDKESNIKNLTAAQGDVNTSIDRLINARATPKGQS